MDLLSYPIVVLHHLIKTLAEYCPDLADELLALNERFVDLIEPFRSGGYYNSEFKGA